jgi:hypothetical protein
MPYFWRLYTDYPANRSEIVGQLHRKVQQICTPPYAVTSIASYGYEKDDVAIAAARKVVEANTDLDEKDMRNALNRSDTIDRQRLYKKEEDGTPMGFVHSGIGVRILCSTIVDITSIPALSSSIPTILLLSSEDNIRSSHQERSIWEVVLHRPLSIMPRRWV